MPKNSLWTDENIARLKLLAGAGHYVSFIAREIGCSRSSALHMAARLELNIQRCSPEEQSEIALKRNARRRARARRQRITQGKYQSSSNVSKTSAHYRSALPPAPEMTVGERRAMLAEAVRNTAAMGAAE